MVAALVPDQFDGVTQPGQVEGFKREQVAGGPGSVPHAGKRSFEHRERIAGRKLHCWRAIALDYNIFTGAHSLDDFTQVCFEFSDCQCGHGSILSP